MAGAALAASVAAGSCRPPSEVERKREAAVAEAEREVRRSPLAELPRAALITVVHRARWRPILRWPDSCEEAFQASRAGDDGGLAFHTIGPGLATVEVRCAAGSYQPSHVFLRFDERGSSPVSTVLAFPAYRSEDGAGVTPQTETELFGETAFSPDGRELSVLSVARQIGDCGIWTRYAIATEHPRVVAAASRLPCSDRPSAPAEWNDGNMPAGWSPMNIHAH